MLGMEGAGANGPNQRNTFMIDKGTSTVFSRRVTEAILSMREEFCNWPDAEERKKLARIAFEDCGLPHVVGIANGTLFPLAFEPESIDAPDHSGRDDGYSLTTMIVCDYNKKIRYYLAGFPGCAHDNRVYNATGFVKRPNDCFADMEHNIGDSAFENSPYMVSSFRKGKGETLVEDHEKFNTKLAIVRIRSEHCIGILKGCFPWLRSIRMKVTDDPKSVKLILRLIDATVVLHNMLIEFGEEEKEEWIDCEDFSDYDDELRAPFREDDVLNRSIAAAAPKDTRRKQLLRYFKENAFH